MMSCDVCGRVFTDAEAMPVHGHIDTGVCAGSPEWTPGPAALYLMERIGL